MRPSPLIVNDARDNRDGSRGWRTKFGRSAEQHVARRLEAAGVRVLARNHRCRGGEIDLIGLEGQTLVFFEVKARRSRSDGFGTPCEAVGARKQGRLAVAARHYLRHCLPPMQAPVQLIRFDVIQVRSFRGRLRVEWIRDAFRLGAW